MDHLFFSRSYMKQFSKNNLIFSQLQNSTSSQALNNFSSNVLTNHSLGSRWLTLLSFFTAIVKPEPGLVGTNVCSSIHPFTYNYSSLTWLSEIKFLVAVFNSFNLKHFKVLEVLLKLLLEISSCLPSTFESKPVHVKIKIWINHLGHTIILATILFTYKINRLCLGVRGEGRNHGTTLHKPWKIYFSL